MCSVYQAGPCPVVHFQVVLKCGKGQQAAQGCLHRVCSGTFLEAILGQIVRVEPTGVGVMVHLFMRNSCFAKSTFDLACDIRDVAEIEIPRGGTAIEAGHQGGAASKRRRCSALALLQYHTLYRLTSGILQQS
jgi:hypothetical protein